MNWLGIFALILLLNTLLLASILAFFVIHHLTTSNPAAAAAPAAATIASAVPTRYSAAPTVPACPICPVSATVLQTTTVIESRTTTTITSTTVDASMESQKLLLKLLDAYLEANRNHLSHHSPYDAPPSHSPEIYPGVVEGSAIYEELLKKLKFAEAKEHNYEQAPPYPGSSAVCSMQLDVEAVSKCAVWRNHGYCESHPATLHLLCKKTCLCRARRNTVIAASLGN